jgi:hypothetical protein
MKIPADCEEREQVLNRFDLETLVAGVNSGIKITFIPKLKGHVLTPKFGKESDLWVQLGEESVRWKEGFFRCIRQKIHGRLSTSVRQENS